MDLVEDEVLQDTEVLGGKEDLVLEPREDVLEHDIVCDQDVGGRPLDLLPRYELAVKRNVPFGPLPVCDEGVFVGVGGVAGVDGDLQA